MSFTIRKSFEEKNIQAAAWLEYRGYIISMSTIPMWPETAVFSADEQETSAIDLIVSGVSMESILEAKAYIDGVVDAPATTIEQETMSFTHVTDPVVLAVLNGDISEDAICQALTATSKAIAADMANEDIDLTILKHRVDSFNAADHAWNELGDAAACVESLKEYWS